MLLGPDDEKENKGPGKVSWRIAVWNVVLWILCEAWTAPDPARLCTSLLGLKLATHARIEQLDYHSSPRVELSRP